MTISPRQALEDGAKILEPFLNQKGFTFFVVDEGKGSGGPFATGEFRNGHRRLEIHFRYSLGLVRDHIGQANAAHQFYMTALGVRGQCHYPGFSDDPLAGFRHVLHDLELFADDFLVGSGVILAQAAESELELKKS